MEKEFNKTAIIIFAFLGAVCAFLVIIMYNVKQHTEVTIMTLENGETYYSFRSNYVKNGDTHVIIKDRDTVLTGVVVDGAWK
jgi:hypothetical protein